SLGRPRGDHGIGQALGHGASAEQPSCRRAAGRRPAHLKEERGVLPCRLESTGRAPRGRKAAAAQALRFAGGPVGSSRQRAAPPRCVHRLTSILRRVVGRGYGFSRAARNKRRRSPITSAVRSPLALLAVAFACGIALAEALALPVAAAAAAALLAAA